MRKLTRLWQAFELIPSLRTTPAHWEHHCGPDYPVIRPYLRPTEVCASTHPCPSRWVGNCPRQIIDYGDGEIVAKCREPWLQCGDIQLNQVDILIHEVDLAAFTKAIAPDLGVRWQPPDRRDHCVWGIGLSTRRNSRSQPVFLSAQSSSRRCREAVNELLISVQGPFVLVAPTDRHRDVAIQERLQTRGISFISLDEQLLLNGDGGFVSLDPTDADGLPPTPVADRERVVNSFRAKYDTTVQKLADEAEVHIRDLYKWVAGQLSDKSKKSKRIEAVLQRGMVNRRIASPTFRPHRPY
jgi:hypothetical protein